jgi:hypothetical protein
MPISDKDHEVFTRPPETARLWRYMNLSKYLAMLSTETLWFSRADRLGDPFEGSISRANIPLRTAWIAQVVKDMPVVEAQGMARTYEAIRAHTRQFHFISCWHRSDWESAAMWRLYMQDYGIAIVSSYERMRSAIDGDDEILVGEVRYIDYDLEPMPEDNFMWPFMHKRRSFEHEREVRAVILRIPTKDDPSSETSKLVDLSLPMPEGIAVAADLRALVEEVRVAPEVPNWFTNAVRDVTTRYSFEFPVRQSDLDADPVY